MVYTYPGSTRDIESDYVKVLDDMLETLRWVRQHPHDPKSSEMLRQMQGKVGYLAQSIEWRGDGNSSQAESALGVAQGKSFKDQTSIRQMWEEMWWSH